MYGPNLPLRILRSGVSRRKMVRDGARSASMMGKTSASKIWSKVFLISLSDIRVGSSLPEVLEESLPEVPSSLGPSST